MIPTRIILNFFWGERDLSPGANIFLSPEEVVRGAEIEQLEFQSRLACMHTLLARRAGPLRTCSRIRSQSQGFATDVRAPTASELWPKNGREQSLSRNLGEQRAGACRIERREDEQGEEASSGGPSGGDEFQVKNTKAQRDPCERETPSAQSRDPHRGGTHPRKSSLTTCKGEITDVRGKRGHAGRNSPVESELDGASSWDRRAGKAVRDEGRSCLGVAHGVCESGVKGQLPRNEKKGEKRRTRKGPAIAVRDLDAMRGRATRVAGQRNGGTGSAARRPHAVANDHTTVARTERYDVRSQIACRTAR